MVRLTDLEDDFYELDAKNFRVIGQKNKRMITFGDEVTVEVKAVNLMDRTIDLYLVTETNSARYSRDEDEGDAYESRSRKDKGGRGGKAGGGKGGRGKHRRPRQSCPKTKSRQKRLHSGYANQNPRRPGTHQRQRRNPGQQRSAQNPDHETQYSGFLRVLIGWKNAMF
jgi:hypothetical protein